MVNHGKSYMRKNETIPDAIKQLRKLGKILGKALTTLDKADNVVAATGGNSPELYRTLVGIQDNLVAMCSEIDEILGDI